MFERRRSERQRAWELGSELSEIDLEDQGERHAQTKGSEEDATTTRFEESVSYGTGKALVKALPRCKVCVRSSESL